MESLGIAAAYRSLVNTMAEEDTVNLDALIERLVAVRGSRPGKLVEISEAEIEYLCRTAREIFLTQPILLELEAPIKVKLLASHIHCKLLDDN